MKNFLKILLTTILAVNTLSALAQSTASNPSGSDINCFFNWYERYTFLALNSSPVTQWVGKMVYKKYQNGAILGAINNRVFMRDKMGDTLTDRGEFSLHISAALASNCGIPVVSVSEPCPISNLDWIINGNKCQALTSSVLSGASVSLGNTAFGSEGRAEFSCNNGIWSVKSGASCMPISTAWGGVDGGDGDGDGGDGGGGVGDGVPIANAPITLVDAKGKTIQTTTDSKGDYRVSLKGLTPPYIVKVTRPDGTEWYSPSLGESDSTGFVRMNITGLTDKVANYVADSAGIQGGAAKVNPSVLLMNPAALQAAKNKLNAGLSSPLTYAGINPAVFDPVRNNYVATKGDKYDGMLDRLVVNKSKTQGNTVVVGTFAGDKEGFINGTGFNATFRAIIGIATDNNGNIYVADTGNNVIRKISSTGVVSTFAGSEISGFTDGVGSMAKFNNPYGVAIDNNGDIYVADTGNNAIRKITKTGLVSTVAGGKARGLFDGIGNVAVFNNPIGIVTDKKGNIYVTDANNNSIRKITPNGFVSTFAGGKLLGFIDGLGMDAAFNQPWGIAIDSNENIYVVDKNNSAIRKITPAGLVSTFAGRGTIGFIDGVKTASAFNLPLGITIDIDNNIYIADTGNKAIRKITKEGVVSVHRVLYTHPIPTCISIDRNGYIYVADFSSNTIQKMMPMESEVKKVAGGGVVDLNIPLNLTIDKDRNIYVADTGNHAIRKITPNGLMSIIAGGNGIGIDDGSENIATLGFPSALAVDKNKNIYFADSGLIRKVDGSGIVSTIEFGFIERGELVLFRPSGMAVDLDDNIYFTDGGTNAIRRINSNGGRITTIAGGSGVGFVDGAGNVATFNDPKGITVDNNGNIYVVDSGNNAIRKISSNGIVTTIAVGVGISLTGIAIDHSGNIYVVDSGNNAIRKIDPIKNMTTEVYGLIEGGIGYSNGVLNAVSFNTPMGIAIDKNGHLFVADTGNNAIRVILP